MARAVYSSAWRKEVGEWMNNPHTSSMSNAMKAHAAKNKHKPKRREAKMCQACGAVSIIGSDRLKQVNENTHGAYYCDKECAASDRGRVYRTSESYREKININYAEKYGKETWENDVCRLYYNTCTICGNTFCTRNHPRAILCSAKCRRKHQNIKAWIVNRKTQTPREVQCAGCGIAFTALTRTKEDQHYCSRVCVARQMRRNRKHTTRGKERERLRRRRGKVSLTSQFYKFKKTCQLCGCKVEMLKEYAPNQASVDHIVPLSRGGLHVEENLQLACVTCNAKKSNMLSHGRQLLLY